ncbi:MAG: helix-turn-helix transcriptional regulator [Alphaproteobacteria bacterium]|nr:helix-turn-helix transcriptional regulator [Alphaproteobacteria bacterium]
MSDTRGRRVSRPIEDLIGGNPEHERNYQTAGDVFEGARLIKAMRDLGGLTQEAVAARLDVSQPAISTMESGRGTEGVTYGTLKRIARACGVDVMVRIIGHSEPGPDKDRDVLFEVKLPATPPNRQVAEEVGHALDILRKHGVVELVPRHVDVRERSEEHLVAKAKAVFSAA